MITASAVLRARVAAAGVQMTSEQSDKAIAALAAQGWKLTSRGDGVRAADTLGRKLTLTLIDQPADPDAPASKPGKAEKVPAGGEANRLWAAMWDAL